jgi:BlaI family penicillinase repressor
MGHPVGYLSTSPLVGGAVDIQFTERELDLMNVLWDRGPSTVAEVRQSLSVELAYTTVLTILRVMEEKGMVAHDEEGRAHRYRPLVARAQARTSALRRITERLFSGDPELLLTRLVEDEAWSAEDLERMRALLDDRLGKGRDR